MIIVLDDDDDIHCELLMLTDVTKFVLIKKMKYINSMR